MRESRKRQKGETGGRETGERHRQERERERERDRRET